MPIRRREVRAHYRKTFHPVFRNLRREVVKNYVFDVLRECEAEFIDWLYDQLKLFMEFEEGTEDLSEEENEEDIVYKDEHGFPLPPEVDLDTSDTDTSLLNASAFSARSTMRAEEEKKRKEDPNYVETESSSSSSEDLSGCSIVVDEGTESTQEKSPSSSPKKEAKSIEFAASSSTILSKSSSSSGCFSDDKLSYTQVGDSSESSSINQCTIPNLDDSNANASLVTEKTQESNNSSTYSSKNVISLEALCPQKLYERQGNFNDDQFKRVLGTQVMNLEPIEASITCDQTSGEASDADVTEKL